MRAEGLGSFIQENMDDILSEWEVFAKSKLPAAATMSVLELRDHAEEMLREIAEDIGRPQSETERDRKAKGLADATEAHPAAASQHGAIRHLSGFDLIQVVSEFRALRAAVLRLWKEEVGVDGPAHVDDLTRFSESIDQALAESVVAYSATSDESRDTVLAVLGHDLRGPLASLSNCVQLQGAAVQTTEARDRVLHIATRSIASMDEMITDLLEYTRTRLGRGLQVSARPANLDALCQETVEEVRAAHPRARIQYEGCADLVTDFDRARMHQVLINLSIKHI
jgi:signal transduction histidine kinase